MAWKRENSGTWGQKKRHAIRRGKQVWNIRAKEDRERVVRSADFTVQYSKVYGLL
jgi:hypothetical protein